ncbi:MAG TPA: M61 family peptidase, partial [Roseivirga sp.]
FNLPEDYKIASGLQPTDKHSLHAKSYYQLVDSPIFASPSLRTIPYEVEDTQYYIHIQGDLPQSDEQLIEDFLSFTQKQMELMGGFPAKHYHFLIQSLPYKAYHGVEHWNSTVICLGPSNELGERTLYKELLGVSCHELFHTWNVIRLRPKEMVPYNFQAENYHQTGFVTEGVTTYYGDLFLARSGVFNFEEYLQELNKLLKRHYENEGRKAYSVGESSFDLWLDGYERGVPGRKVSIYNEGALAAMILDLTIRLKHDNQKSLDDVMRLLWEKHGEDMSGYSFEDYQSACETVYDGSLQTYFDEIILGLTPFEKYLIPLLDAFGLKMALKNADRPEEDQFGFRLLENKVDLIATGSPAEQWLSINDIILKVNDEKLDGQISQGEQLTLEVLRMGKKKTATLTSDGKHYFQIYQLQLKENLSNTERELLKGWLETCFRA